MGGEACRCCQSVDAPLADAIAKPLPFANVGFSAIRQCLLGSAAKAYLQARSEQSELVSPPSAQGEGWDERRANWNLVIPVHHEAVSSQNLRTECVCTARVLHGRTTGQAVVTKLPLCERMQ
jgi:hypothetical protein